MTAGDASGVSLPERTQLLRKLRQMGLTSITEGTPNKALAESSNEHSIILEMGGRGVMFSWPDRSTEVFWCRHVGQLYLPQDWRGRVVDHVVSDAPHNY